MRLVVQPVAEPDPFERRRRASAPLGERGTPAYRRPSATLSTARTPDARWNCWKTNPIRPARSADSPGRTAARRRTRRSGPGPEVGRSRVPRMFSIVDLPEPDGPTIATSSPGSIRSDTPARAATPPAYTFVTSVSSITWAPPRPGPRMMPAPLTSTRPPRTARSSPAGTSYRRRRPPRPRSRPRCRASSAATGTVSTFLRSAAVNVTSTDGQRVGGHRLLVARRQ